MILQFWVLTFIKTAVCKWLQMERVRRRSLAAKFQIQQNSILNPTRNAVAWRQHRAYWNEIETQHALFWWSVSEMYRMHTGVIMPVTAGGHASTTVTALRPSVMQMYTRVGTVKAAVALMRPRWLTSWHCCWMHKCLQIHHAAMSDGLAHYSVNYCKSDCSLYKCWYRPVCLEGTH